MSQATTHRTTHPCPHGERTDRTTRDGEPICALCRADAARLRDLPDPVPDWQTLRAADDTLTDTDPRVSLADGYAASDAEILAVLFSDDTRGRRLRHRIRAAL
jgi:hypothetical protein